MSTWDAKARGSVGISIFALLKCAHQDRHPVVVLPIGQLKDLPKFAFHLQQLTGVEPLHTNDDQYSQDSSHWPQASDSTKASAGLCTNKRKKKKLEDVDKCLEETKIIQMAIKACTAPMTSYQSISHLKAVISLCSDISNEHIHTLKKHLLQDMLNSLEQRVRICCRRRMHFTIQRDSLDSDAYYNH